MRRTASRAGRRPKALESRRSGRAGEPPECVGKPCRPVLRSSGAAAAEGGCPTSPAATLLPAPWPDGSPARSLWVNTKDHWYKSQQFKRIPNPVKDRRRARTLGQGERGLIPRSVDNDP